MRKRLTSISLVLLSIVSCRDMNEPSPGGPGGPRASMAVVSAADMNISITDLGALAFSAYSAALNNHGQVIGYTAVYAPGPGNWPNRAFFWQNDGRGMRDIGTLGGTNTSAGGINDRGQVVGGSQILGDAESHAFLWQDNGGGMIDLGSPGGPAFATAINRDGQVFGTYSPPGYPPRSFFWEEGRGMIDLGTLGSVSYSSTTARGMNNLGQVVGLSYTPNYAFHAFLWQNGMTDLDPSNLSRASIAVAINDASQVAGYLRMPFPGGGGCCRDLPFVWQNGVITELPTMGWTNLMLLAINARGQVLGGGTSPDNTGYHALVWDNGVMIDLGTLGGSESQAYAINDLGQVVGWSYTADGTRRAFLWQNGVMINLGSLGGGSSEARAINDVGQVAGSAMLSQYLPVHAVLWSTKQDQTITFAALADKTFGDPPFTVSAIASSGLPVGFTASGNCTVSGSIVTLTDAGACTLTADQAGDANFNPAPGVAQSFTIAPRNIGIFLHGSGGTTNPATLSLDALAPMATTAKSQASPGIKFAGGNPWTLVGAWTAAPELSTGTLLTLGDVHMWLGLKNSDDIGTTFDVRVEAYKNGTIVASGQTLCVRGLTRNPGLAKEVTAAFASFSGVLFNGTTDVLSLKVLARIGTNGAGGSCGGHGSAVGLLGYFDATSRAAKFDAAF